VSTAGSTSGAAETSQEDDSGDGHTDH